MTTVAATRTVQQWLDLMVERWRDSFDIANQAMHENGCATTPVRCTRCSPAQPMTFVGAVRHLRVTEAEFAAQRPELRHPHATPVQLHKPGDLVDRSGLDHSSPHQRQWSTEECRSCHQPVIWARTPQGKRMPVNAEPDPAGRVLLSIPPGGTFADTPLIAFLNTRDAEHTPADPGHLRTPHWATCPHSDSWRRR